MALQTPPVGWTERRKRRVSLFTIVVAAVAVLALWAMTQPWVGVALGGAEPTCDRGTGAGTAQVLSADGESRQMSVTGCISGYQSVHQDDYIADLGLNPAQVKTTAPLGAPTAGVQFGIPSATFWLVAATLLVAGGCLMRNGFLFIASAFPLQWSYGAFATHREALVWGLDPAPYAEMSGITYHSIAFMLTAGMAVTGGILVMKVNSQQRKLDMEAFKRGERDRPAGMTTISLITTALLRVQMDKLSDTYSSEVESKKGSESSKEKAKA